jgi:hypothetical protein
MQGRGSVLGKLASKKNPDGHPLSMIRKGSGREATRFGMNPISCALEIEVTAELV